MKDCPSAKVGVEVDWLTIFARSLWLTQRPALIPLVGPELLANHKRGGVNWDFKTFSMVQSETPCKV